MGKKLFTFATSNKSLFVQMKLNFLNVVTLIVTVLFTSSCLGDDTTDYEYSSEASITAFAISGEIETTYNTVVNGVDTTLVKTLDGTLYPFAIDQMNHQIYTVDSLPLGTDVSKVVVSISGDTSYILIAREENDTVWTATDSLNFESPIRFKVMSLKGTYGPTYTAKINVHQQDPDSMMWTKLRSNFSGTTMKAQKAVTFNNRIFVFAANEPQVTVTSTAVTDGSSWTPLTELDITESVDYESVMVWGDKLYLLANGQLYSSVDALVWSKEESAPVMRMLVANVSSSTTQKMIGISLENHFVEGDISSNWEKKEVVSDRFPKHNVSYATSPLNTNSSIDRMVVLGVNGIESDTISSVWSRLTTDATWGEFTPVAGYTYCPKMENPAMIQYNDQLYAFGGTAVRSDTTYAAMGQFFVSANNGANWRHITNKVRFPEEFKELYERANGNYSYVVDENNFLWIFFSNSQEVWKGRINKLNIQ
ncbi:MAG: DUF6242 domain-containing protein [Phocaeicola sp.]